ncbi:cyclase family protein [Streptomyces antimycoticus]|uniref:cyclase family protein n=1 Tax=Streptomyces antimycoticus TaxID=68175 RepID=UPI001374A002|nr:cyclase family protein [Streptomyces antimycoticus]
MLLSDRLPKVIDLSRTLTPAFPTTIADVPPVRRWTATTRESHGFEACGWSLVEHIGTHVDAPVHFMENGRTVTDLSVAELVVRARAVDFVAKATSCPSAVVTVQDLVDEERRRGPIPRGSAVLLCSGWGDRPVGEVGYLGWDGEAHRSPGWSAEAVGWLLEERGVTALGTDTSSIDAGDAIGAPAHQVLLGADRYAIEGLVNLERLLDRASFTLVVGVMPWKSGTGGPCRALALLDVDASDTP